MKILSLFALGSLILLGGCQPREAGRTAPEPQPGQQPETPPEQVEEGRAVRLLLIRIGFCGPLGRAFLGVRTMIARF